MKLKRLIFSVLTALLFTVEVYAAAGTITGTIERMAVRQGSAPMVEIVLTATADSTLHTWPATVVNTLSGISDFNLKGLKLYSIKTIPSAVTAPTAGTSVTITDSRGVDLLGDKGSGLISNTAKTWAAFGPSGYAFPALVTGNFTITLSGNSVDSAIIIIVLELVGD